VTDTIWETWLLFTLCSEYCRLFYEEGALTETFYLTFKGNGKDSSGSATALNNMPCDQSSLIEELYLSGMTSSINKAAVACTTSWSEEHDISASSLIATLDALSDRERPCSITAMDTVCVPSAFVLEEWKTRCWTTSSQ